MNITQILDTRIAQKQAELDAGAITPAIFESNKTHFLRVADMLNKSAVTDICSKFGVDPSIIAEKLAMKTQDKAVTMLLHLSNSVLFSDPYATPIILNAIPFAEKSVEFSNTDQCATLCEAVDSDNRAKMKFKKAYTVGTAASQASQVRRLLCDLGIATEHNRALSLNLDHPIVMHIKEKAKAAKKK